MLASLVAALALFSGVAQSQHPAGIPLPPRPVVSSSPGATPRWQSAPQSKVPVASNIIPVRYQRPGGAAADDEGRPQYQIQLQPPGLERISQLDSDETLRERIRQETVEREGTTAERVAFPEEPILSRDVYYGRGTIWPRRALIVEPNFVTYRRLYFQDLNAERHGWDLGPIQPVLSTMKFWYDLALFPMHFVNDPCGRDCSAGYCLPGDPVPYQWYPPEVTLKGSIVEIGTILALVAIFP